MMRVVAMSTKRFNIFLTATFIFVVLGFGLTGCRSSKDVPKRASASDVKKLETYIHKSTPFKTLDSKVEFKFSQQAGIGASMKGTVRVSNDSCIILSVQPFGIEAFKCLIVKDSIVFVNRLDKTFAIEKMSTFEYAELLNISTLQDILTNRIFVPGDSYPDARKLARFDLLKQKDARGFRWSEGGFILDYLMDNDSHYYRFKAFKPETTENIQVNYSQFKEETFGSFPRVVNFATKGMKQNLSIQILYSKPSFDSQADFKFEIPAKYKRVSSTEMIKRFQNMI